MTGGKVLVVDDEVALLDAICDYLTIAGFSCVRARTAAEALTALNDGDFDALLTDLSLSPGGDSDGLAIVSFARERGMPRSVIVMTAHEQFAEAAARMADRFFLKPIPLASLVRELDEVLSRG